MGKKHFCFFQTAKTGNRTPNSGVKGSGTRGRSIRYMGGGPRVFAACKLFFCLREKTIFFFGNQRPTIFFLSSVEKKFCRMLSFLCRLPFGVSSGQHIFHKFRQQTFFPAHIFTNLFFPTFVATNYFFQFFLAPPPPPDINWCVPNHYPRAPALQAGNFNHCTRTLALFTMNHACKHNIMGQYCLNLGPS